MRSYRPQLGFKFAGSSWVVGQVWGIKESDKYLLHMVREQMGFADTLASIRLMDKLFEADEILIENKANGPATIETLKDEIGYKLKAVEPGGSKSDRAYAVVPQFERGEVWLPEPKRYEWVKPLLTEVQSFPKSVTDDCVDAMTQVLVAQKSYVGWEGAAVVGEVRAGYDIDW